MVESVLVGSDEVTGKELDSEVVTGIFLLQHCSATWEPMVMLFSVPHFLLCSLLDWTVPLVTVLSSVLG